MKLSRFRPLNKTVCFGGALMSGVTLGFGADPTMSDLQKENADLRRRMEALEAAFGKEGMTPPKDTSKKAVNVFSDMTLSGFVTASYFYDTSTPDDNSPNGYLWNRTHNSFSLNKVKLILASPPAERSGEKWAAGYRVSLIWGEDAPVVNTGGEFQGFEPLREAYVDLNVPIGTGLNIKVGQLISLLNFESGDGGAANPNFSQGNQWFFTGNGPSAGIQASYALCENVDATVRVQNGLFTGAIDNNGYKTLMGNIGIRPDSKTSIGLFGFGGREGGGSGLWLKGGSLIATRKLEETHNVNFALELDYFNLDLPADTAEWWSIGGWLWMDLTSKLGVAFRADYIGDGDGAGTSGLLGFPANTGQDLYSATFTLNYRPLPNIKISPEIRYDHTSLDGGFDGRSDRLVLGAGVSYLF